MINEAYFLNTCTHIPNLTECIKDEGFNRFMKKSVKDALCITLGSCLANEILSYQDPVTCLIDPDDPTLPEHLKWLIFGHEFEPTSSCTCTSKCNCVSVGKCEIAKWKGILDVDNRESYLAYFTYYQWMCKPSAICCKSEQHESLKQMMRIDAYNNFVGWVCECNACSVSLYGFLREFKELFPTHEGTCLRYKNIWLV